MAPTLIPFAAPTGGAASFGTALQESDMTKKMMLAIAMTAPLMIALPAAADGDHRAKAIAVIKKDFQPRGQASSTVWRKMAYRPSVTVPATSRPNTSPNDWKRTSWQASSFLPTAS
jgi:hypothetical protein